MNAIDAIRVGDPLPRIASVVARAPFVIDVQWANGEAQSVDLSPDIFTYKFYAPLRDDAKLFASVHAIRDGSAIAWGENEEIDMPATAVERLASEIMEPADFSAFLKRNKLTYDAAAAQLGLSRRQVAYYASEKKAPRHVALACAFLERRFASARR